LSEGFREEFPFSPPPLRTAVFSQAPPQDVYVWQGRVVGHDVVEWGGGIVAEAEEAVVLVCHE